MNDPQRHARHQKRTGWTVIVIAVAGAAWSLVTLAGVNPEDLWTDWAGQPSATQAAVLLLAAAILLAGAGALLLRASGQTQTHARDYKTQTVDRNEPDPDSEQHAGGDNPADGAEQNHSST